MLIAGDRLPRAANVGGDNDISDTQNNGSLMKIVPANATARPPRAPVIASNTYNYCKATLAASARV